MTSPIDRAFIRAFEKRQDSQQDPSRSAPAPTSVERSVASRASHGTANRIDPSR